MKKILIPGREENAPNYAAAITACGALPVFSADPDSDCGCGALLLTGGCDVNPALYGQENWGCQTIDDDRDRLEFSLIRLFLREEKPIFGICRGMQVLGACLGGDLVQDLSPEQRPLHTNPPRMGDQIHPVSALPGSCLEQLYGPRFTVTSSHHQACRRLPPSLRFLAYSDDGVPEALGDESGRILAVQWHPERMAFALRREDTADGALLFRYFLARVPE